MFILEGTKSATSAIFFISKIQKKYKKTNLIINRQLARCLLEF